MMPAKPDSAAHAAAPAAPAAPAAASATKSVANKTNLQKVLERRRPMPPDVRQDEQICEACSNTAMWVRTLTEEPCDRCGALLKCWACLACDVISHRRVCKTCGFVKILPHEMLEVENEPGEAYCYGCNYTETVSVPVRLHQMPKAESAEASEAGEAAGSTTGSDALAKALLNAIQAVTHTPDTAAPAEAISEAEPQAPPEADESTNNNQSA